MRSQIFIGSSAEGLKYLTKVQEYLSPVGDCIAWPQAFTFNRSALDSLIVKTKMSDFAILIATNDDITIKVKRKEVKNTARDNIIFEFGLFMGAGGVDRAFLIAEEGIDLPTDLNGITVAMFSQKPGKYNSLDKVCHNISQHIQKVEKVSTLGMLPSTALALGYYNSFIKPVCQRLSENQIVVAGEKSLTVKKYQLHVIIPQMIDDSGVNDFIEIYNKNNKLLPARTCEMQETKRGYPFHFKIDPAGQDEKQPVELKIFDIPTTLNTLLESIKLFLPQQAIGEDDNTLIIHKRELHNFIQVLKHLIKKSVLTQNNVHIIHDVVL